MMRRSESDKSIMTKYTYGYRPMGRMGSMGTERIALAACQIELGAGRCIRDGEITRLSATETRLLAYFIDNPRRDIPRSELLAQVFGYKETVRSRTIDTTIQRLRKKIEADASDPQHILTVHGIGYQFVPLLTSRPSFFPTQQGETKPGEQNSFFGRKSTLETVREHLEKGVRQITVVGTAGIGKTRFASRLAKAVKNRWTCCRVDVSRAKDATELTHAVVDALHSRIHANEVPNFTITKLLDRSAVLLVLDGFEHLVEHATLLEHWLSENSGSRILVTSRAALGHPSEVIVKMGPLGEHEAAGLFLARARAVRPDFASELDLRKLQVVVNKLERIPLTIEIAAAQAKTTPGNDLLNAIIQAFDQQTQPDDVKTVLDKTIRWSWKRLNPHQRRALVSSTIFCGGFGLTAAEAIFQLPQDAPPTAQVLETLLEKSLLCTLSSDRGLRLDLVQSVRDFVREQLSEGERERLVSAHADYFLTEGERWTDDTHLGDADGHNQLIVEFENLGLIATGGDPMQRLRAMLCRSPIVLARGLARSQVDSLSTAIADQEPLARDTSARAMRALSDFLLSAGKRTEARAIMQQGIAAADGHPAARFQLASRLAWLDMTTGDKPAREAFKQIIAEATSCGQEKHAIMARLGVAAMALRALELDEAEVQATRAADVLRELNLTIQLVDATKLLAFVGEVRGDLAEAKIQHKATIEAIEYLDHPTALVVQLGNAGRMLVSLSDDEADIQEARRLLNRAQEIEQALGMRIPITSIVQAQALLCWDAGDPSTAQAIVQKWQKRTEPLGPMGTDGDLMSLLGDLFLDLGDFENARTSIDAVFTLPHTQMAATLAHGTRALLLAQQGDPAGATSCLNQAKALGHTPILRAINRANRATIQVLCAANAKERDLARTVSEAQLLRLALPKERGWLYARRAAHRLTMALQRM
jgi:DNA-binding winged helix-turn-helix (wHTH) protein/Ni2+-binding GTPase involved in maturation of urease and hydrogenase